MIVGVKSAKKEIKINNILFIKSKAEAPIHAHFFLFNKAKKIKDSKPFISKRRGNKPIP